MYYSLFSFIDIAPAALSCYPKERKRKVYMLTVMFAFRIDILAAKLVAAQSRQEATGNRVQVSTLSTPRLTRPRGREWNSRESDLYFIEDDIPPATTSPADDKTLSRIFDRK